MASHAGDPGGLGSTKMGLVGAVVDQLRRVGMKRGLAFLLRENLSIAKHVLIRRRLSLVVPCPGAPYLFLFAISIERQNEIDFARRCVPLSFKDKHTHYIYIYIHTEDVGVVFEHSDSHRFHLN